MGPHSHMSTGEQRPAWNIPKREEASQVDAQQTDPFLTHKAERRCAWPPL